MHWSVELIANWLMHITQPNIYESKVFLAWSPESINSPLIKPSLIVVLIKKIFLFVVSFYNVCNSVALKEEFFGVNLGFMVTGSKNFENG